MGSCWKISRNSKNYKKSPKVFHKTCVFPPSNFEVKLTKKRPQTDQKSSKKNTHHVDPILNRFLNHLGSILRGFWRPSWKQVGTKCHQKPTPNPIKQILLFRTPPDKFWMDLGSPLRGPGGIKSCSWLVVLALGALLGPRWPQDAPRSPKTASNTDVGTI